MINRYETANGEDILTGEPVEGGGVKPITPMATNDLELYVDIVNGFTSNSGALEFPLSSIDEALNKVAEITGGYIDKDVSIRIFSPGYHNMTLGRYFTDHVNYKFNFWGPGSIEFISLYSGTIDYSGGSETWGTFVSLSCMNIRCRVAFLNIGFIGQATFKNMTDVTLQNCGLMSETKSQEKSMLTIQSCKVRGKVTAKSKGVIRIVASSTGGTYSGSTPRFHAKDGGEIYVDYDGAAHDATGTDTEESNGHVVLLVDNWNN